MARQFALNGFHIMDAKQSNARQSSGIPQILSLVISCALILVVVVILLIHSTRESDPLKPILLATGEWAPYSGEKLADYGVASGIVSSVLRRMGYQPQFRFVSWELAEKSARQNEDSHGVRGTFPYYLASPRNIYFYFSDPILEIELSLFYNRDRTPNAGKIAAVKDLAGYRIVPIKGYRYPKEAEHYLAADLSPAGNNTEAFKILMESKEPLLVLEATRVGEEILRTEFPLESEKIKTTLLTFSSPVHFISSKRNPQNLRLINLFNETLSAIKKDGSLDELKKRIFTAIDAQRMVLLQPIVEGQPIRAFSHPFDSESVLLPRGTRAVVEQWSRAFLKATSAHDEPAPEMVKVRLLNSPLRGKSFYVDGRSIVLP